MSLSSMLWGPPSPGSLHAFLVPWPEGPAAPAQAQQCEQSCMRTRTRWRCPPLLNLGGPHQLDQLDRSQQSFVRCMQAPVSYT